MADHGEPGTHPWNTQTNQIGTIPPLAPETPPNPGAESWQAFLDRSGRAQLRIADRYEGRRVLVVAHSETAASALHTFMRQPVGASRWMYPLVNHTALCGWRGVFSPLPGADPTGQWAVVYAHDDPHLPVPDRIWQHGRAL